MKPTRTVETEALIAFLRENGPFTEREVIAANLRVALERAEGNKSLAARMLGMTRWTIMRRIGWLIGQARREQGRERDEAISGS